jgi:hypothetical protein
MTTAALMTIGSKVVIAAGSVELHDRSVPYNKGDSDVLWGPKGSRFAVIRSVTGKTEEYRAIDLRTGFLLREESWEEGKRRDEITDGLVPDPLAGATSPTSEK